MKRIFWFLTGTIIFIIGITLSGCIDTEKEIIIRSPDNSTITLYPDNQFIAHYTDTGNTWHGEYQKRGDRFILVFPFGVVQTFIVENNTFIDQDGIKWATL